MLFEHGTAMAIRQARYLNNVVGQDHRAVKRVTRPMLGFKPVETAQRTLAGIELMHMLRKGQWTGRPDQALTAAEQLYVLAA
jgi:putative transposase